MKFEEEEGVRHKKEIISETDNSCFQEVLEHVQAS